MSARLVLLGPPGAGKGTQAVRLAESLGVPAISTGDIFRANIKGGTALGLKVQEYTSAGALVPDELTNAMVRDRLAEPDVEGGFLLDGYPRNVAQVAELDDILTSTGRSLDVAVEITADAAAVVDRLLKRAEIEGRADDTESVVRHRLDVYAEQTAPIAGVYASRDLLVQVDGIGAVDEVTQRLLAAIAPYVG
ncbi:adenylate kinase [Cellulomonas sp. WB94]|uniref:adenylate kinase n=1 Tax=Cellulomonas sp. WB94 TaxID=2173174 RepID=UPI000D574692|nr:adenylate kinase [Cellulomonas sp. WB94]PVU82393.1 adenylate kinase [Cellulomonas sp. WB94]